jgi:capsular exopolysaccharide synthesis family protein
MPSPELNAPNLRLTDLLQVLRHRWTIVAITTGVCTVLLLGVSLSQAKQYTATSRVIVRTVASETVGQADPNAAVAFFADRQVKNATDDIMSTDMRSAVAKRYGKRIDVGSVTAVPEAVGSDAIDISVTASTAKGAADLANLYAQTYIDRNTKARAAALRTAQKAVEDQIASIDDERARASRSPDATTDQLAALDLQRSTYVQRLQSLQLSAGLVDQQSAQLVSRADPPSAPVSPKPVRDGVIGLMLGLGLGIAIALAREFLDDSVRTSSDLDELTDATVPTLGAVPRFEGAESGIVTISTPASLAAEAFRAVRTSVRFVALDRAMKVIQVTSTTAGEGKTTVVANLAAALAQAGHRVAVVSCDLRRPDLHRRFDEPSSPGLTDVLLGECLLSEAMRETSSGVYLLPSGDRPPNPSELLGSSRMKAVVDFLVSEFDFVLLDSTPILSVTDAVVVSQFAQATLVVVAARDTHRQRVREALDVLIRAGAPLAGLILNKTNPRDQDDLYQDEGKRAGGTGRTGWSRARAHA